MKTKTTIITSASFFLVTLLVIMLIFSTEPQAKREAATKRGPMLVKVTQVQKGNFRPVIKAMGTAIPAQEIRLQARVSGEVLSIAEGFTPGAVVPKGETLLQIDDADYRLLVQQRYSQFAQAKAALDIEMGEQAVAEREFKQIRRTLSEMQKALMLRQPQLANAQAELASAKSALAQAELNLARTKIKAPFNATILKRQVNVGSNVSANEELGHLVSTENYWVEATLPAKHINYLEQASSQAPLNISIRDRNAWPKNMTIKGRLLSVVAEQSSQSRLVRVLIEVPDPLHLNAKTHSQTTPPPLLLGAYVESQIPTRELTQVVRLERQYLRKNNTVWVMENEALSIRKIEIALFDEQHVYISAGLNDNDAVVISDLSRVREGAPLSLHPQAPSTGATHDER